MVILLVSMRTMTNSLVRLFLFCLVASLKMLVFQKLTSEYSMLLIIYKTSLK